MHEYDILISKAITEQITMILNDAIGKHNRFS